MEKENELTEGAVMDKILKYCNDKSPSGFKYVELQKEILSEYHPDRVRTLQKKIMEFGNDIARFPGGTGTIIVANGNTLNFLNSGGFTKIEADEKERILGEQNRQDLEIRKTKVDLVLAEKMLEDYPSTKRKANIAIAVAISVFLFEVIKFIFFR